MRNVMISVLSCVGLLSSLTGCGKKEAVVHKPNPDQVVAIVNTQTLTWKEMDQVPEKFRQS